MIYRFDRNSRGGGVAIIARSSLSTSIHSRAPHTEAITVHLHPNLLITCIYVSPNCSDFELSSALKYIRELATSSNHTHLIVGDFNAPDIDWATWSATSHRSSMICNAVFDCNLYQFVTDPTHVHGNTLDLIFTDGPDLIADIHIWKDGSSIFHLSDHYIITFAFLQHLPFPIRKLGRAPAHVFNYSKANWSGLCDYLLDIDFTTCFSSSSVNSMWNCIKDIILHGCQLFIPTVRPNRSNLPRWFTPAIHHFLNKVRSLRRRKRRGKLSPSLIARLDQMESTLHSQLCEPKKEFELNLIKNFSQDKRSLFRHFRSITTNSSLPARVNWNHLSSSDPREKCELLNGFFNSVFTCRSSCSVPKPHVSSSQPVHQLSQLSFSESEVWKALANLDPTKAAGLDGIGPKLLKECATPLAAPLSILFNACVSQGAIPEEWKAHLVIPIFKSGNRSDPSRY